MASELIAGLGVFKTLFDMTKGLKDINDAAIRSAAIIELQEKILTAREQQTALLERISTLEKKVASFETWDREKQRYELKALEPGAFAYLLKPTEARGEPAHALCATCYQHRVKSLLQSNGELQLYKHHWDCPVCKAKVMADRYALEVLKAA